MPRIRLHDLRHTHATLLLQADTLIMAVSERLGKARTSITLDTYAHVLPAADEQTANTLARHILGETA